MDLMPEIGHGSQEVTKSSLMSVSMARNSTAFVFNFNQLIAKIQGCCQKSVGSPAMLSTKAGFGCSSHSWHLAASSLSIFSGEVELEDRQIFTGPQLERNRKADDVDNVVKATAMGVCSCLPHGWLWIAHTMPHQVPLKTKGPGTSSHDTQD